MFKGYYKNLNNYENDNSSQSIRPHMGEGHLVTYPSKCKESSGTPKKAYIKDNFLEVFFKRFQFKVKRGRKIPINAVPERIHLIPQLELMGAQISSLLIFLCNAVFYEYQKESDLKKLFRDQISSRPTDASNSRIAHKMFEGYVPFSEYSADKFFSQKEVPKTPNAYYKNFNGNILAELVFLYLTRIVIHDKDGHDGNIGFAPSALNSDSAESSNFFNHRPHEARGIDFDNAFTHIIKKEGLNCGPAGFKIDEQEPVNNIYTGTLECFCQQTPCLSTLKGNEVYTYKHPVKNQEIKVKFEPEPQKYFCRSEQMFASIMKFFPEMLTPSYYNCLNLVSESISSIIYSQTIPESSTKALPEGKEIIQKAFYIFLRVMLKLSSTHAFEYLANRIFYNDIDIKEEVIKTLYRNVEVCRTRLRNLPKDKFLNFEVYPNFSEEIFWKAYGFWKSKTINLFQPSYHPKTQRSQSANQNNPNILLASLAQNPVFSLLANTILPSLSPNRAFDFNQFLDKCSQHLKGKGTSYFAKIFRPKLNEVNSKDWENFKHLSKNIRGYKVVITREELAYLLFDKYKVIEELRNHQLFQKNKVNLLKGIDPNRAFYLSAFIKKLIDHQPRDPSPSARQEIIKLNQLYHMSKVQRLTCKKNFLESTMTADTGDIKKPNDERFISPD